MVTYFHKNTKLQWIFTVLFCFFQQKIVSFGYQTTTDMDSKDLIVIRRFGSEAELRIAQALLGSADVETFATNEYTSWVMPTTAVSYGLCVKAEDVKRAIEILEAQSTDE